MEKPLLPAHALETGKSNQFRIKEQGDLAPDQHVTERIRGALELVSLSSKALG